MAMKAFGEIRRQVFQRDIAAGHFAAACQHAAVEPDDLDGRRPLGDFQRLDRRQMRADPDHHADDGDARPQAKHGGPVEQPSDAAAASRFGASLAAALAHARLALRRGRGIVVIIVEATFGGLLRLLFGSGNAILGIETQISHGCGEPELRLLASALFPSPRHTPTLLTPVPPHATVRTLRAG